MKLDFNWHGKTRHKNAHGTKKAFDEDRNADFNRYSDVVLWDATRVRLRRGPGGNDYIHASHVKGGDFPMICAQGPVEESVERFWIMIVEQNCQVGSHMRALLIISFFRPLLQIVVQLCQNEEDGKEKCFRYLPAAEQEKFGGVSVKVKEMTKTMPSNQEVKRTILEASFAGRTIEVRVRALPSFLLTFVGHFLPFPHHRSCICSTMAGPTTMCH
jgi:protein tyrosine phosphatase